MQKIAKVQATRTQAPAELALLILVANIFPAVNRARKISRFLASELLPQWLWIRFISSNMLKFCQLLWSNLVKMHSEQTCVARQATSI